jgi:two-component system osmolarity sensor histidine kinase EnvZ
MNPVRTTGFDTTRRRVIGLLALAVTGIVTVALALASHATADVGGTQVARALYAASRVADAALAAGARDLPQDAAALGMRVLDAAVLVPLERSRITPLAHTLETRLLEHVGDPRRLRICRSDTATGIAIAIRSEVDPRRWFVIAIEPLRDHILARSWVLLPLCGALVVLLGGLIARGLTRPLERLAREAEDVIQRGFDPAQYREAPSEITRLGTALDRAAQVLRNTTRERELLLAGVSHDLRTPLARLRLALELGDAADAERRQAMVHDIEEMDAIVGDFLAYVREGSEEAYAPVSTAALLDEVLEGRTVPWQRAFDPELQLQVKPRALRRALVNLIDNAERHGAAPFRIEIRAGAREIVFAVCDAGPGIAAGSLADLLRPFARGARSRRVPGSGLGLAITARLLQEQGGRLEFEQCKNGGFEARIALPLNAFPGATVRC